MGRVLAIAGIDSSGGAGLARDLAVIGDHRLSSAVVVTAVTAQTKRQVSAVHLIPATVIRAQIAAALEDHDIAAVKIGMLGSAEIVHAVAKSLADLGDAPIVLDPVLRASSGGQLLSDAGRTALVSQLLPRCRLITPNLPETAELTHSNVARDPQSIAQQAARLMAMGATAVLIKGGHGDADEAIDWLFDGPAKPVRFSSPRWPIERRGTGCTLATAIACNLAKGDELAQACAAAKQYLDAWLSGNML